MYFCLANAITAPLWLPASSNQSVDHGGIGQRRGIPQVVQFVRRNLAQDAAHDLSGPGLGQGFGPLDDIEFGDGADFGAHLSDECGAQCVRWFDALIQHDAGIDTLPLDHMRVPDDGGFGHIRVLGQRTLQLDGAHAMAGYV